ncbi:hypothetical protein G9A89_005662 [Geosiphon pyriformis]|nr:hypothetical protein G9A89_005662 [Geosiphon pyriformis]
MSPERENFTISYHTFNSISKHKPFNKKNTNGFKAKLTDFQLEKSKKYAWHASQAYCLKNEHLIASEIYANVEVQKGEIILTFKGEKVNYQSYWDGREKGLIPYQYNQRAFVDKIFFQKWNQTKNSVSERIIEEIKYHGIYTIVAVGHGIGGVYATFAILELLEILKYSKFKLDPIVRAPKLSLQVFTFGQPHIGDREFARHVNDLMFEGKLLVYRFTNTNDYVPQLPESTFQSYYTHHAWEYWIASDCECALPEVYVCQGPKVFEDGKTYIGESQANIMMGDCIRTNLQKERVA